MSRGPGGPRRRGRELVFRLLYQADLTRDSVEETWKLIKDEERLPEEAREYVEALVVAIEEGFAPLDRRISEATQHWKIERLAATDRSVLRLAVAELLHMPGTPARVVLDEAVVIARKYGRDESGGFVNGVLDRVARTLRPGELEGEPADIEAPPDDAGDPARAGER
jgi:N utilization substance protein B